MDGTGQVIGFTARIIVDDPKAPKYLNTQQTLLYDKSRHVFGLSQAKEAIRTKDYAVVVEGNLDVVSSHQAKIEPVVAAAGTALTEFHLKALRRLSGNVRLAFDNDKAGLAATERAIPIAQAVGVELSIITLESNAKDADELIQQDAALWQQSIDKAEPVVDWVLKQYAAREDVTTAAGKRRFTTAALAVIRSLEDAVERDHYVQMLAEWTGSSVDAVTTKMNTTSAQSTEKRLKSVTQRAAAKTDDYAYQDNVLALGLLDGMVRELFVDVQPDVFVGEERQAVAGYIAAAPVDTVVTDTPKELQNYDTYVKIVLLKADTRYASWSAQDRTLEAARLLRQITTEHKKHQKNLLDRQLNEAEEAGDEEAADALRAQLAALIKEIHNGR